MPRVKISAHAPTLTLVLQSLVARVFKTLKENERALGINIPDIKSLNFSIIQQSSLIDDMASRAVQAALLATGAKHPPGAVILPLIFDCALMLGASSSEMI